MVGQKVYQKAYLMAVLTVYSWVDHSAVQMGLQWVDPMVLKMVGQKAYWTVVLLAVLMVDPTVDPMVDPMVGQRAYQKV